MRETLPDGPPEPLPESTLGALRAALAGTEWVARAYLVPIRRTDELGVSTTGRRIVLSERSDRAPSPEQVHRAVAPVGPVLVGGGAGDVGIGLPAPAALRAVEERGVPLWARRPSAGSSSGRR